MMRRGREQSEIFLVVRENLLQSRILYPDVFSFKAEKKTFLDKQKLREFIVSRIEFWPAIQNMLKMFFRENKNDIGQQLGST